MSLKNKANRSGSTENYPGDIYCRECGWKNPPAVRVTEWVALCPACSARHVNVTLLEHVKLDPTLCEQILLMRKWSGLSSEIAHKDGPLSDEDKENLRRARREFHSAAGHAATSLCRLLPGGWDALAEGEVAR